jgi:hypothetical protein
MQTSLHFGLTQRPEVLVNVSTATYSLAYPTVFQASTGQPPCVPRRVISYSPYRMGFTSDDSDSQVAEWS